MTMTRAMPSGAREPELLALVRGGNSLPLYCEPQAASTQPIKPSPGRSGHQPVYTGPESRAPHTTHQHPPGAVCIGGELGKRILQFHHRLQMAVRSACQD